MNIVVELEFPWEQESTEDDQEAFGEMVLRCINSAPLHPLGGQVASVKVIRGSMTLTRRILDGKL